MIVAGRARLAASILTLNPASAHPASFRRLGRVDVVFNVRSPSSQFFFTQSDSVLTFSSRQNAGVDAPNPPLDELPIAEFDRVMAVNVRGAVLMTMGAMKAFKAQEPQGGRIISTLMISHRAMAERLRLTPGCQLITSLSSPPFLRQRLDIGIFAPTESVYFSRPLSLSLASLAYLVPFPQPLPLPPLPLHQTRPPTPSPSTPSRA